ncbi:MAG: NAD(P)/FAD-dependent oxidoreductase [Clostridiales bacterium]|jgi:NADPH-dependent 2,4-dienoyl-CoA reductase/sulfur reductase-like enzyme|nr:NAD(P)/FAD-dependent oxidoreductase [Clostridiales bacterium]
MSENYLLVGNGCAAMECAKSLRENGYTGNIYLLSDLLEPAYNPMLITYFASGKIEYDAMFPYGSNMDFYTRYNILPYLGSPVINLDAKEQFVENSKGLIIQYDKALIATGSSPIIPPAFSNVVDYVYTLRTIEDGVKFRKLLRGPKKRVLVVGASMVGIKAVEALVENDFEVCLVDFAKYIFPMIAHKNCSLLIQEILRSKNVKLRFGTAVERVEKDKNNLVTYFTDEGSAEEVDCIVVCAGVRPNISFLDPDQVDIDHGILVNQYMETNVPGLYAAGDVSQGDDLISGEKRIIGLWANARYQGRTAGANMAGKKTKYLGTLPHNITHFMEHDFIGVGNILNGDDMYEEYDEDNYTYCCFVWDKKKLIGVNILNMPEISGILKNYIIKGLLTDSADGLSKFANDSLALAKLYNKYPRLEKKFLEMR